jgi:hypothetical protein
MSATAAVIGGPVVVQVPAERSMARLVRLAASSLAAMTAMNVDDIEDVKIVVSEVMSALIEHGDGPDITIKLELEPDRLTISGYADSAVFAADNEELALSATVLAAIAAEHHIEHADGRLVIIAAYVAAADSDG